MTQKELMEYLHYDPDTGVFTWLVRPAKCIHEGDVAGYIKPDGYHGIKLQGKLWHSHRLAWLYVYGKLPTDQVDHINQDKADNRIDNLRLATASTNQANTKPLQKWASKLKGVCKGESAKKPWRARIRKDGKLINLGHYVTEIEAARAYDKAAIELFGEYAYVNGV